ncbi:Hsp20/alpha crystallin family protein [Robertmurraya massiliosenegalensis]|uniref:Hsp20/alpha crystallin family protein n=1 Tax=Robertmurraya TaxID=2837507 RepID=UPI0039A412F7
MSSKLPKEPENSQDPFGDFRNLMNDFFYKRPVKGFLQSMDEFFQLPLSNFPVQVKELDEKIIITAELPGVKKEQISIDILERSINISVKNVEMVIEEDEKKNTYKKSQSTQQLSRNIYLGHVIDEKNVKASYQNGLLKIRVPKLKGKQILITDGE